MAGKFTELTSWVLRLIGRGGDRADEITESKAALRPPATTDQISHPRSTSPTRRRILVQPLPQTKQRTVVQPDVQKQRLEVRRSLSPYWQDQGWNKAGDVYRGYFYAHGVQYPGEIIWKGGKLSRCLIANPPPELWKHPHGACFGHIGNGWYSVHFRAYPRNIDAAILTVERILNESARYRGR